jgi:hypothetical protein
VICWVASYPRSGNNLFRTGLLRYCGVRAATVFEEQAAAPLQVFRETRPLSLLRELGPTVPVKTHRPGDAADPAAAVYLVRDGRDSIVSYAHFLLSAGGATPSAAELHERMAELVEGHRGFGTLSAHVETWTTRQAPTHLVRFEDLVHDPVATVREAAAELGLPLPPLRGNPQPPEFDRHRAAHPRHYRRGITGSWRTEMPAEVEARFWELHGECMQRLGYERESADQ